MNARLPRLSHQRLQPRMFSPTTSIALLIDPHGLPHRISGRTLHHRSLDSVDLTLRPTRRMTLGSLFLSYIMHSWGTYTAFGVAASEGLSFSVVPVFFQQCFHPAPFAGFLHHRRLALDVRVHFVPPWSFRGRSDDASDARKYILQK